MPNHGKGPSKKQFCPYGHNTFVVGRSNSGRCRECNKVDRHAKWTTRQPEERKIRAEDQKVVRRILSADRKRVVFKNVVAAIRNSLSENPTNFENAARAAIEVIPNKNVQQYLVKNG